MTQLEKLKAVFDELGIEYHEMMENGFTYIAKLKAHDVKNESIMFGFRNVPLRFASQLQEFFEFDDLGEIASW